MAELSHKGLTESAFSLSRKIFYVLLFLYFIFSSAELLHLVLGIYKPKVGHIVALLLLAWMVLEKRVWKLDRRLLYAFLFILASLTLSAIFGSASKRSFGYVFVYVFNFVLYFLVPLQLMQNMNLNQFFRIYWNSYLLVGLYATLQVMLSLIGVYEPFALQRIGSIARGQAWSYEPSYYALYMVPYVMYWNGIALFREKSKDSLRNRIKLFCQNMLMVISTSTGIIISYPVFFISAIIRFLNPLQKIARKKLLTALSFFAISLAGLTVLFYEIALHSIFKFFYFGFLAHHGHLLPDGKELFQLVKHLQSILF
jgi:hypothetical protein